MPVEIAELVARADRLAESGGERIARSGSCEEIATVMEDVFAAAEREQRSVAPAEDMFRPACGPGCNSCCVVNVSVLVPEAITIASYLTRSLSPAILEPLAEKVGRQAETVRWVDDQERPRLRLHCSFLDERGWCLIHPVRPFLCRSISSADAVACAEISVHGEAEVVMNIPQKILCSLAFTGLARTLQQHGLDSRSLELNRMVSNLLARPSLVDHFVARKRLDFQ